MALQEQHVATVENLFASQVFPVVSDSLQVAATQGALKRGTLLTAEGKICHKEATGGGPEQSDPVFDEVYAVLAEDVDTTSGAVVAPVYLTGEFREDAQDRQQRDDRRLQGLRSQGRHFLQARYLRRTDDVFQSVHHSHDA